ncbi:MAG: MYG1 family protein [Minisyncoccia bacterium]
MKIVTHSGRFHVDDVFAVATALFVYPDSEIVRSRDEEMIKSADIAIDVGFISDPDKNRFDHHQPEGAGKRENGIPYSSFGLVWRKWGEKLAGREGAELIDRKLVSPIDANDNGVSISANKFPGLREYTVYDIITAYSEEDGFSEEELLAKFKECIFLAQGIIGREINIAQRIITDTKEVLKSLSQSKDKRLVVLDKPLLWGPALSPIPEVVYVVYPRKDETWGAQAVSKNPDNYFQSRKLFPATWGGKVHGALAEIAGVKDAIFCHTGLFLCVAKTRDGAVNLAKKALDA